MNVASRQQTGQKPTIVRPYPLVQDKGMWTLFEGKRLEVGSRLGRSLELLPMTVSYFGTADLLVDNIFPKVNYGVLFATAENWDSSPQRAEADFKVVYRLSGQFVLLETESDAIIRAYRTMRVAEELFCSMGMSTVNAIAYADSIALQCNPFALDHETLVMPKSNGQKPQLSRTQLDALDTQELVDKLLFERRAGSLPPTSELPRDYYGNDLVPGTKTIIVLVKEGLSEYSSNLLSLLLERL